MMNANTDTYIKISNVEYICVHHLTLTFPHNLETCDTLHLLTILDTFPDLFGSLFSLT